MNWISSGFEELAAQQASGTTPNFDVLIVGSGYGGAIAADVFARSQAAGQPVTVCVLERGREYLPGAFACGFRELPGHIRMDRNKEGLFDIRGGPEVNTVLANGLGGGSLVNAGVMERPSDSVFADGWPYSMSAASLGSFYDDAKSLLGARHNGSDNTIELLPAAEIPLKYDHIRTLANQNNLPFRPAAITVAMADTPSTGNVQLNKCNQCGDCATGCNFGAKESLDVNLLYRASENGARIYTGATVLKIERDTGADSWIASAVHTDSLLRRREGKRTPIHARKIILAAGALGSTEILMRSQSGTLSFSSMLGRRCSTNGDMLVADYDTSSEVNTVADESDAPSGRRVGPTITGIVDLRTSNGILIEEMSVPAGLRRAFTEIFGTVNALHMLDVQDDTQHMSGHPNDDIFEVGAGRIDRSSLYAVMGDDRANGSIGLYVDGDRIPADQLGDQHDGVGRIEWQGVQDLSLFDDQVEQVAMLCVGSGGQILPNPIWKLLPANLMWLLDNKRGPVTTVHPLGGCAMAEDANSGVVDDMGQVFDPTGTGTVHEGLVVLDGSIVPTAIGTNPALTIAAVSLRAAGLLAAHWGYSVTAPAPANGNPAVVRPVVRNTDLPFLSAPTTFELFERLDGPVIFKNLSGSRRTRIVELTLRFNEHEIAALTRPSEQAGGAALTLNQNTDDPTTLSRIRIYEEHDWNALRLKYIPPRRLEAALDRIAVFNAPLTGTLDVFVRAESQSLGRMLKAGWAYSWNRGTRDAYQMGNDGGPGLIERLKSGKALASRSGEMRLFEYKLDIGAPTKETIRLDGTRIVGRKRFTYARKCNPWRQLMEVEFDEFPGLGGFTDRRVVKLDPVYLTRIGVPLFRLTRQEDGATAISDLIGFFGYVIRLLVGVHIWSFRHPDAETVVKTIDGFPRKAGSMPDPAIISLNLPPEIPAGGSEPIEGQIRLTRFVGTDPSKHPVLLLHGYSTSGSAFSHPAVYPNFASHLWDNGRDVWILDMRTSSAYPETAKAPWSFEQIAYRDIPIAVHEVYTTTGKEVDIHAHCIGAAMLSMVLLRSDSIVSPVPGFPAVDPRKLRVWIRRISMSQVGPLVVMSPANIFRGYALRYFLGYLPDDYQFRPEDPSLADDLLDRILYTLPYPEEEFTTTNPVLPWKRAEWTRTRHRMDALYGRSFNLVNVGDGVLENIDDLFGPLSIRTVTQAIHFARSSMITDVHGRNSFVARAQLNTLWRTPMLNAKIHTFSVHGSDNGLTDLRTLDRIDAIMQDAGMPYTTHILEAEQGVGHQDALIGHPNNKTFDAVLEFLDADLPPANGAPSTTQVAYPPWIGPIVTQEVMTIGVTQIPVTTIRVGTRPTHRKPECVVMLPVEVNAGQVTLPGNVPFANDQDAEEYIAAHLVGYTSARLRDEHWDAFLRPDFPTLPGYTGAVLVLVIYNEAEQLGSLGMAAGDSIYFGVNTAISNSWLLNRIDALSDRGRNLGDLGTAAGQVLRPVDYQFPYRLAATVRREFLSQPFAANGSGADPVDAPPRVVATGPGSDETDAAVLDRLRDEDYDLIEGVFTHRAPNAPVETPDPAGTAFVLGSCQFPSGFLDEPIAYSAYSDLRDRLEGISLNPKPKFALFCGDQVYVDPTAGLFDPTAADDRYTLPYQAWLRNSHVRNVLRLLPSFMLLDDHEIVDNWEPVAALPADEYAENVDLRTAAVVAFRKYQHGIGAPDIGAQGANGNQSEDFRMEGVPIFMLDTRSRRSPRTAGTIDAATLFDETTSNLLEAFLTSTEIPKFVVSPSMFLPRYRRAAASPAGAIHSDGWNGYPESLYRFLRLIVDEPAIEHVVFLSGDAHCGAVATIDIKNEATATTKRIHSIHTPGLHTPYPFANGSRFDLIGEETFKFQHQTTAYQCTVATSFPATRNRFTYFNLKQAGGNWILEYQFGDEPVLALSL